ncbi:uncharacterized protein A1O9_02016 [Exophiala aquamarina CBS 119918]|uniref:Uncharacterized protein n=1 Tax=Exophiala aquamarina CBS 119918 TaxID=1182545 RepID=A0A072PXY0_9EURO|nr:uncharacterized protein A1O9_02016 [Exophiala aquamarina CBS 119918]KEF60455.1 hypothetical protein A1O9_02016 [Exophiala aquamarina CBS 119918]
MATNLRRFHLLSHAVDDSGKRRNIFRAHKNTSRYFHTTSRRSIVKSPSHYGARPRPRQRSIPSSSTPDPLVKVNRGLDRPADHVLYPGIQSLLNPEEAREELRIAEANEKRLIQSEMESAQAAHSAFKQHIRSHHEKLSAFSLTEQDLERAVKAARIDAKFSKIRAWRLRIQKAMETRVSELQSKSLHILQKVDSSVDLVDAELQQWRRSVAKYRQELAVVGTRLEASIATLKSDIDEETGRVFFNRMREIYSVAYDAFEELLECTSMTSLTRLNNELASSGISSATGREPARRFLAGLEDGALRRVLIDLAFWAVDARPIFAAIGLELHYYRRLRVKGLAYKAMPEVFAHDYRQLFRAHAFRRFSVYCRDINQQIRRLRGIMIYLKPPGFVQYDGHLLKHLPTLVAFEGQRCLAEFRSVLEPLAISNEAGDLPLQQALLHDLRPFYDSLVQLNPIRTELDKLNDCWTELAEIEKSRHQSPLALVKRHTYLLTRTTAIIRETQEALDTVRIWRAIANVALGIHKTSRIQHWPSMEKSHDTEPGPNLNLGKLSLRSHRWPEPMSAALNPIVSWLPLSPSLYPLRGNIPIHYVTTMMSLKFVSQRFARSSLLGIDLVLSEPPTSGPYSMKSRINFLLIASENEVAVVDMDYMPVNLSHNVDPILQQTLGNPRIVKVGVHTELQRRILGTDNGIDLVNAVDLSTEQLPPETNNDPTFQTLSTMADANLGSPLPKLLLTNSVLCKAGTNNPILYFGHLACRPYAALQLLNKARAHGNERSMSKLPEASLGPIIVHPLPKDYPGLSVVLQKISPPLYRMRYQYLRDLVEEMCTRVIKNNAYLRARQTTYCTDWRRSILEGYIRLTTFGQSFQQVCNRLDLPLQRRIEEAYRLEHSVTLNGERSHGLLAFTLLSLVRTARLPLSLDHEPELRAASQKFLHTEHGSDGDQWAAWARDVIEVPLDRTSRKKGIRVAPSVASPSPVTLPSGRVSSAPHRSILPIGGRRKLLSEKRRVKVRQERTRRETSHVQKEIEENANIVGTTSEVPAIGHGVECSGAVPGKPQGRAKESTDIINKVGTIAGGTENPCDVETSSAPRPPPPSRRKTKILEKASKVENTTSGRTDTSGRADSPPAAENVSTFFFGNFIQTRIKPIFAGGDGPPTQDQQPTEIAPTEKEEAKRHVDSRRMPKLRTIEKRKIQQKDVPVARVLSTPGPKIRKSLRLPRGVYLGFVR